MMMLQLQATQAQDAAQALLRAEQRTAELAAGEAALAARQRALADREQALVQVCEHEKIFGGLLRLRCPDCSSHLTAAAAADDDDDVYPPLTPRCC
jgi:hypothetical protein